MRTAWLLIVMPRSRSMSMRSRYWARMSRSLTTPVMPSIRSARVDLPWSMCAMMQKLRIFAGSVDAGSRDFRARGDMTGHSPMRAVAVSDDDDSSSRDRAERAVLARSHELALGQPGDAGEQVGLCGREAQADPAFAGASEGAAGRHGHPLVQEELLGPGRNIASARVRNIHPQVEGACRLEIVDAACRQCLRGGDVVRAVVGRRGSH